MTKPLIPDDRIDELLRVEKALSSADVQKLRARGRAKQNRAFTEVQVELAAGDDHFRIHVQRHTSNPLQFAIQLIYVDADENEYRLLRVAGRTGPHTNQLEQTGRPTDRARSRVTDRFRINRLTERYQASNYEEDEYAEAAADRFSDFESAFDALTGLANVTWPTAQAKLL